MNRSILAAFAGVLSLHGQVISLGNTAFQALGNPVLSGVRVLDEGFGNQVVRGKPFSATEERHSLQVLGDATRIENSQTNRLYRDADGRTRVEEMNGQISIYDPTNGLRVQLDPATKTARKGVGGVSFYSTSAAASPLRVLTTGQGYAYVTQNDRTAMQGVMSETTENLGSQPVNGVTAQGVRTSMIIPKGQIGNNKDIKVMTERWSSSDLQMLVKSTNSDPRFGETTYQLSKITQSAPDPALFQIPADYTVIDQGAARGAGRAATPAPAALPGIPAGAGRGVGAGAGAGRKQPLAPSNNPQ